MEVIRNKAERGSVSWSTKPTTEHKQRINSLPAAQKVRLFQARNVGPSVEKQGEKVQDKVNMKTVSLIVLLFTWYNNIDFRGVIPDRFKCKGEENQALMSSVTLDNNRIR